MRSNKHMIFANQRQLTWRPGMIVFPAVMMLLGILTPATHAQENLPELIQQARGNFKPVTPEQLTAARAEATAADARSGAPGGASSANGQRWLKYLRWDGLKPELAKEGAPNLEALDATLGQINRDEKGLELPRFRRLADALRRYRDLTAISQWENPTELYGQQLDALQRQLDAYRAEPTPANEIAFGTAVANHHRRRSGGGSGPGSAARILASPTRSSIFPPVSWPRAPSPSIAAST